MNHKMHTGSSQAVALTSGRVDMSNRFWTTSTALLIFAALVTLALSSLTAPAQHAEKLASYNEVELQKILKPGNTLNVPVTLPVRDEFASIIFTKGTVLLNGNSVQSDDKVRLNDQIETGASGYASLEFQTGTLINLQPNTIARILVLHCQPGDETCVIEMAADQGTLTTDVRRDGKQPTDFRVQTPYASAAVRGTKFDIDADDTGLRIGVTEGNVDLSSGYREGLVPLDTGFGVPIAPGTAPGELIALLPAPVFRFVPPRIAIGDTLRWFGLTDTDEYTVQIAASSSGVGIVHDVVVGEDVFVLNDELASGDFSLLLRAVDDKGLKGFVATTPITIAALDRNIEPVNASVQRDGSNFRISVIEQVAGASGYEVQVAVKWRQTVCSGSRVG